MTDAQWQSLLEILDGRESRPLPVGFIVDSVWLPRWAGISVLDYYTSEPLWYQANRRLMEAFPEVMIFPGFWAEFGMFSEPSAFGARCVWAENDLPFPEKCIVGYQAIASLAAPDVERDGLLPFMIKRLAHFEDQIRILGHRVRFAVSRGPLNIATFLLGGTELLLGLKTQPAEIHRLLELVSTFITDWLRLQKRAFPSIEGVLILDDIVGFVGPQDFREFAYPYLKEIFAALDLPVRFFHNDADARASAPMLAEMGINMFNFSHEHSLREMTELAGPEVTLVGNIPPRDMLDLGNPEGIRDWVRRELGPVAGSRRLIASCGGGLSPGTTEENLRAFLASVRDLG